MQKRLAKNSLVPPNTVYASEKNQNGIIIETNFDRNEYVKEDEIIYSVYLRNTNSEVIYVKDINLGIPEGFVLTENNENASLDKIEPGQDILLKYYLNKNDEDDKTPESNPDSPDSNQGQNNSNQGQSLENLNNDKEQQKEINGQTETGDNNKVLFWGGTIVVSGILIIFILMNRKHSKKLFSIIIIGTILVESAISPISAKAKESEEQIEVSEYFIFDQLQKELSFKMIIEKENKILTDTTSYSRAEWIYKIIETYGLNVDLSKASETNFTDINTNKYKDVIRVAEIYGVIDRSEKFHPNEIATREFATVTAVRLLALQGEGIPKCADLGDIIYQKEVYLGLKAGLVLLEEGKFNPKKPINNTNGKIILKKIEKYRQKPIIEENIQKYGYKKGIIQLDSFSVINKDEKYITLKKSNITNSLKENAIFVIRDQESFKVEKVYAEGDHVRIQYSKPKLEEFLDNVFVSGHYKEMDLSKITLVDGVSISKTSENDELKSYTSVREVDNKKVDVSLEGVTFEKKLGNNEAATLKVYIPYIEIETFYDFDNSASRVKEAYFGVKVEPEITIEPRTLKNNSEDNQGENPDNNQGENPDNNQEENESENISTENIISHDNITREINLNNALDFANNYLENKYLGLEVEKTIELLDYAVAPGLSLHLDVNLEAGGIAKLGWKLVAAGGVRIIDNVPSVAFEGNADFLLIGEFEASAGLEFSLNIEIIDSITLLSLGVEPGLKFTGEVTPHISQPILCTDFKCYLTAKLGILDSIIADVCDWLEVDLAYELFDEDNTPFKIKCHPEIGKDGLKLVKECSHEKSKANVHGYIKDKDEVQKIISNAEIKIFDENETEFTPENVKFKTTTDENGYFSLEMDYGTFLIMISADNYYRRTETIIIAPGTQEREFFLQKDNGVCKIDDIVYPSIAAALKNAKSGDIITVFKDTQEPEPLIIPENKEITILSEEFITIKRKETTTDSMIINKGNLKLMGPMTFDFYGLTLLNNYSMINISGGVKFIDQMPTSTIIKNSGELSLSNSSGNSGIEYECIVQGCGNRLNIGIWNAGIITSNHEPFCVKDVQYGIVFESEGTHDLDSNYYYENVEIPSYTL